MAYTANLDGTINPPPLTPDQAQALLDDLNRQRDGYQSQLTSAQANLADLDAQIASVTAALSQSETNLATQAQTAQATPA